MIAILLENGDKLHDWLRTCAQDEGTQSNRQTVQEHWQSKTGPAQGTAIRDSVSGIRKNASREGRILAERKRCPVYRGEFERLRHVAISFHHRSFFCSRVYPSNGQ